MWIQFGNDDCSLPGRLGEPDFSAGDCPSSTLEHSSTIFHLSAAIILAVPEMEHLGRQKAIFAHAPLVVQPQYKVGILVTPPREGFVKAVDGLEITLPHTEIAASDAFPTKMPFYTARVASPVKKMRQFVNVTGGA